MAYSNTRSEAREKGEHLYSTGVPCKRGHVATRFTKTAICTDCNREQSAAWSRENADKKAIADAAYRQQNLEKSRQRDRDYYAATREVAKAKRRDYHTRTADARHEASRKWREANSDKARATQARFRAENKDKINAWAAFRRARKAQGYMMLSSEQKAAVIAFYTEARKRTIETGILHEVDHIHPLAGKNFSGLHVPWNLQVIPSSENRRKGNRLEEAA